MTGTSPPGPLRCGSITFSVNAVATAASKALPPFSSTAMPTAVAIQCVVVTTPNVPSISGRVVKAFGLILVINVLLLRSVMRARRPAGCASLLRSFGPAHRDYTGSMYPAGQTAARAGRPGEARDSEGRIGGARRGRPRSGAADRGRHSGSRARGRR